MITPEQQSQLRTALDAAFKNFKAALSSIDEDKINKVPFQGSWTPAQVTMHIILATDGVPDGSTSAPDRTADAMLPAIRPWWEDLSQKFQAPEPLLPDDRERSRDELISELDRVHQKDLHILGERDLTEICLDFALPTIGYLTRFEWLWFIEMHLNRHAYQLKKIHETFATHG